MIRRLTGLKCTTSLQSFYVRRWRKWRTLPMWGHRGFGLSLDSNSMGLAWHTSPKSSCPREYEQNCSLDGWLDLKKRNVFNIDIHNIGRVEIKRYHKDTSVLCLLLLLLLLLLLFILITNHFKAFFCGMQRQLSSCAMKGHQVSWSRAFVLGAPVFFF